MSSQTGLSGGWMSVRNSTRSVGNDAFWGRCVCRQHGFVNDRVVPRILTNGGKSNG